MMRRQLVLLGALAGASLCSWLASEAAPAQGRVGQVVHVVSQSGGSEQEGHGVLGRSGAECLLLTPKHVVQFKDEDAERVKVTPSNGPATTAQIKKVSGVFDLAVLGVQISECPDPPAAIAAQEVLPNAFGGFLSLSTPSGGEQRFFVRIAGYDNETITLIPEQSDDSFQQGMSGALLMGQRGEGALPIGMVLNARGREATAMRLDKIRQLEPSFWSTAGQAASSGGVSGPRISTLKKYTVSIEIKLKSPLKSTGETWDFGFPTVFRGPDPFVFIRFSDGSGALMGFPNVTELSAPALQPLGMLWNDACSNRVSCTRESQVFGEVFEEVTVFDYDPTINSLPGWELIGSAKGCRLNQLCDVGGATVLIRQK